MLSARSYRRGTALLFLLAVFGAGLAAGLGLWRIGAEPGTAGKEAIADIDYRPAEAGVPGAGEARYVVFFPHPPSGSLVPVTRTIPVSRAVYWNVLREMAAGPGEGLEGLVSTAPPLRKASFRDGVLWLDFESPPWLRKGLREALTATLSALGEVREVRVLVEGRPPGPGAPGGWQEGWRVEPPAPALYFPLRLGNRTVLALKGPFPGSTGTAAGEEGGPGGTEPDRHVPEGLVWAVAAALAAGPPPEGQGLETIIPPGMSLREVRRQGDLVTVELAGQGSGAGEGVWPVQAGRAALLRDGLALTFLSIPGVARVQLIAGETGAEDPVVLAGPLWPNPLPPPNAAGREVLVRLAVVGDVSLARKIDRLIQEHGFSYPFAHTADLLRGANLAFANLEAPLSERGRMMPGKGIWLRGRPESVEALLLAGIDVVSLANNHILDYDEEALLDTMDILSRSGIVWAGAGRDLADARQPAILESGGIRFAFLAYSDFAEIFWSYAYRRPFAAAEERPGVVPLREELILADVERLAGHADVVVVSFHWGVEDSHYPTPEQRELARQALAAGARVIAGHHPHVLQGVEAGPQAIAFYSLGNFVYDQRREANVRSIIAVLSFRGSAPPAGADIEELEVIPVRLTEGRPRPAAGEEAAAILDRLELYSRPFGTGVARSGDRGRIRIE